MWSPTTRPSRGTTESTAALARTFVASKNSSPPHTSPASWHSSTTRSKKRRKTSTPSRVRIRDSVEGSGSGSSSA
jgi:hypothetical protein